MHDLLVSSGTVLKNKPKPDIYHLFYCYKYGIYSEILDMLFRIGNKMNYACFKPYKTLKLYRLLFIYPL